MAKTKKISLHTHTAVARLPGVC